MARYQEGLGKGFHDPEWIQQAQAAHRSRELGFYDEFMATDFEEKWDMPMPQQPHTGSKAIGNGSGQTSHTPEAPVNDAPLGSEKVVPSEDMKDQGRRTSGTVEPQPADILQEYSPKINVQDRKGNVEDTNDSKPGHAQHISKDENKGDQLLGSDSKQAGPAQVEAATPQNSTESGDQKIEDHTHDVKVSSTPILPAVTEGTEQQLDEKTSEINVTQQVDVIENAENQTDTSVQALVTPPQPIECLAKRPQEHQDGNTPSEGKAIEPQQGDK